MSTLLFFFPNENPSPQNIRLLDFRRCSNFGMSSNFPIFCFSFPEIFGSHFGQAPTSEASFFSPINVDRIYFQPPRPHYSVSRHIENVVPGEKEKIRWLGDENDPSEVGACPTIPLENIRKLHQILLKIDPKLDNRSQKSENQFYVAPMSPIASAILSRGWIWVFPLVCSVWIF